MPPRRLTLMTLKRMSLQSPAKNRITQSDTLPHSSTSEADEPTSTSGDDSEENPSPTESGGAEETPSDDAAAHLDSSLLMYAALGYAAYGVVF